MVEKTIPGEACTNVGNLMKTTDEIMTTPNDVKDVKRKKENDESNDNDACLEIDNVEKSNNSVLWKLLRSPRYFDPLDCSYQNCYNCGEGGHTVTNCTAATRKKPCYLCGSLEHNAKHCKQGKECFYCKKCGHFAKDCPGKNIEEVEDAKICLKCGDSGHEMYSCKTVFYSVDDLKKIHCYICKYMGHLCCVEYGEGPSEVSCYRCGQLGHTGLKCSQEGHKSRRCKISAKKRKRKKAKQSNLLDSTEYVGVRSIPQELGEAHKWNKTQNGCSTSAQPKRRGGWMDDDENDNDPDGFLSGTQLGSLSTSASYRSDNGFHGSHGSSDSTCDLQYEG